MDLLKCFLTLWFIGSANIGLSQVNTFPYLESFEQTFTTGNNVAFITNWTGNTVNSNSRIFQGTHPHSGNASLHVIPTSSFTGEILISLNLTGVDNPLMEFYAFSKQNGAASSTRPVLLSMSTSIDGGNSYIDNTAIGDEFTFPNNDSTHYQLYEYALPPIASGQSNVLIKMTISRGDGSGSAAELVVDDVRITEQSTDHILTINQVTVNSPTEIVLQFNQPLDPVSAISVSNYHLNFGFGMPESVELSATDASIVTLRFSSGLVNNTYTLTANGISNASETALLSDFSTEIIHHIATSHRQIVINEIYADPNGPGQPDPQILPGSSSDEFIELYNASSKHIDLNNFTLSGGSLGHFVLAPGAYVILTATNNLTDFEFYGDVLGVSSWNTLGNTGESLVLKDNLGNVVDSLTYNQSWYRDELKSEGGWSLEQINPELPCSDANNWLASTSVNGGSPGAVNSVFDPTPDTQRPNLIEVETISATELLVRFDEIMDQSSLLSGSFSLDNNIGIGASSLLSQAPRSVRLTLPTPMISGTEYTLTVTDLLDCAGNAIANDTFIFLFDDQAPVLERFVIKNLHTVDLVFDEPLEKIAAETEENFMLGQSPGQPDKAQLCENNASRLRLTFTQPLLPDTDYQLTYRLLSDTLGNVIAPSSETIRFRNALDTVIVISSQLLDVYFSDPLEETAAETVDNYTVDRGLGSPKTALRDNETSELVHLIFEESFDENKALTLGFEQLKGVDGEFLQALNTAFVFDTDRPGVDSVIVENENSLIIYFDEAVDLTSSEAINNYHVDNDIGVPISATRLVNQSSVRLTFLASFINELKNTISFQGIKDLSGNTFSSTRKVDFTYDRLAPRLLATRLLSPTTIQLTFSEALTESSAATNTNYNVDNNIGHPLVSKLSARSDHVVLLEFTSLGNNTLNTLTIANIEDNHDNPIQPEITTSFTTERPLIGQVTALTDSTIQVQFSKNLDQVSAENSGNYSFSHGLSASKVVLKPSDPSTVIIALSGKLSEELSYTLEVRELKDTDANISANLQSTFSYDSQLSAWKILNKNTLQLTFENALEPVAAQTNTHYNLSRIGPPASAVLNSDNLVTVSLILAEDLVEETDYSLQIAGLMDSFGDAIPASEHNIRYDSSPPEILSVMSIFTDQILVTFSEALEPSSAETLNHYSLNNDMGHPVMASLEPEGNNVLLTFGHDLMDSTSYTLTVDRVADLSGNALSSESIEFTFSAPFNPVFRDVVINEIYPDPDIDSPLPNAEFIEIYNAGNELVKLKEFTLADHSTITTLSSFELAPGGFLILTSHANAEFFSQFDNVLGLPNFPSLTNSGETIVLKRRDGLIVDSLQYNLGHYNNEIKQNGGYSIELINPKAHCFDQANYAASTSSNQGTPGSQNAVFNDSPDLSAPTVDDLEILSDTQLSVHFNESMDKNSIQASDFSFSGNIAVSNISIEDSFGTRVLINLTEPFTKGREFVLTISDLSDCSGNEIHPVDKTFALGARPQSGQLIITEIMAQPDPSQGLPDAEYIEVLNVSDQILSLEGLTLSDLTSSTPLPAINIWPEAYVLLTTTAGESELEGSTGVAGFPGLNDSGDLVAISHGTEVIDRVDYSQNWFRDSEKAAGGYSLEMIDTTYPCLEAINWRGSVSGIGGTPGLPNSVMASNPDLIGPKMLQAIALNELQVMITYDERLETAGITPNSFQISEGITVSSFSIDETERIITLALNSPLQRNTLYTLSTEHMTDCSGNLIMANFNSQELVIALEATAGDVLINEVLFNPRSNGVRFVELYNNSLNFINLQNWLLAGSSNQRVISEEQLILRPADYLILSTDTQILANEYPGTRTEKVFEMNALPSLPNTAGTVSLINANNQTIDLFDYSDDFHSPLLDQVDGVSLERIRFSGLTNDPHNWLSASSTVGFATPGYTNSQSQGMPVASSAVSVEPSVFAPDIAGMASFTTINFRFDTPGNVLNVKIFDPGGRLVRQVAHNALVGTEGFFRWDGVSDQGSKARVGYYLVLVEIISPDGKVSLSKKKVVVGTRL